MVIKVTSMRMDEELWHQVKVYCAKRRMKLTDFLNRAIIEALKH